LFFVPVIPYDSHHYLLCDVCSRGFELHGPQIEKAKRLSQATKSYLGKQTTEEQYKIALNETRLLE
jgi:Fe2+ or Zn2+ uptake regulation protein